MKKLILLFLAMPFSAGAANWELVTAEPSANHFLDTESIVKVGRKYRKAWIRLDVTKAPHPRMAPNAVYQKQLLYFDCAERLSDLVQYIDYSPDGVAIDSAEKRFNPVDLSDVAPETVREAMLQRVCNSKT
jgi:hypothetical protein